MTLYVLLVNVFVSVHIEHRLEIYWIGRSTGSWALKRWRRVVPLTLTRLVRVSTHLPRPCERKKHLTWGIRYCSIWPFYASWLLVSWLLQTFMLIKIIFGHHITTKKIITWFLTALVKVKGFLMDKFEKTW